MKLFAARRRVLPFLAVGTAVLLFTITLVRAAHTGITYDESFTYLNYVRPMSFRKLPTLFFDAQTNNHMLNTLLIWVVQVVSNTDYNEFLIRLPSLLFFGLYLGLAVCMLLRRHIPLWVFALLVLNVQLDEFFGLARGYGMAACLTLVALYFHMRWRRRGNRGFWYLTLSFGAFALSGTAITYVLVILLAFGLDALLRLWREKQLAAYLKRQWLPLIPVAALCLFVVAYQFISHRNTGFDPGGATGPLAFFGAFFQGIFTSLGFEAGPAGALGAVLLVWFAAGVLLFRRRLYRSVFVLPFLLNLVVWTLLACFGSAIPTGRGFLIFYPLMVLNLGEMARWWRLWLQRRIRAGWLKKGLSAVPAVSAAVFAVAVFAASLSIHTTWDWIENYGNREALYYIYVHRLDAPGLAHSDDNTVYFYHDQIAYYFQYDIFTGQMIEP